MITLDGQSVIQRNLSTTPQLALEEKDWLDFFELNSCTDFITSSPFNQICLQFPDEWLSYSTLVSQHLSRSTGRKFYVLADTTFGSCCVDEVAAKHVQADLIIHYGQSCKSPITGNIPVKFIYGKSMVDLPQLLVKMNELPKSERVLLAADVEYEHCLEELIRVDGGGDKVMEIYKEDDQANLNEATILLFLGREGPALTHLLITLAHTGLQVYSLDPALKNEPRLETPLVNKSLMKRYVLVQKAKDAQVIGILIATTSTARYMEALNYLQSLCIKAGRKYYILAMGKLNPAKLANFPEIDIFVLLGCPFYSLLDNKEFYRPVITPFELDLALTKGLAWTGEYIDSFQDLLSESKWEEKKKLLSQSLLDLTEEEDAPHFSLITGTLIQNPSSSTTLLNSSSTELTYQQQQQQQIQLTHAPYFANRTYQGLNPDLDNTEVKPAQPGRMGTAKGYQSEPGYYYDNPLPK